MTSVEIFSDLFGYGFAFGFMVTFFTSLIGFGVKQAISLFANIAK